MPKRKASCVADTKPSVSSLDAAFDMLANDTFSKLDHLVAKFESATCIRLKEGIAQARWEEACKRYWVTKAMEDLCCTQPRPETAAIEVETEADGGRPLPPTIYPGPQTRHHMSIGEELEWRKWTPKTGDLVLIDTPDEQLWPGKIIDRRTFFQGRTAPRGNHFFPVRIYSEEIEAMVSVKSRMIPFDLRPEPPLLAPINVLNAYNHARHPGAFDRAAEQREHRAAQERTHPGVHGQQQADRIKERKDAWNEHVNWIMSERRVEKMRNLNEEREKRLRSVAKEQEGEQVDSQDQDTRKRGCSGIRTVRDAGIFEVAPDSAQSPAASPLFKPVFQSASRPMSPRRLEKRRNGVHTGVGEYSPRGRGSTYTPPKILPSGDETAIQGSPTPVPSSLRFDFVSPLGPVRAGKLDERPVPRRSGSLSGMTLEAVKEEDALEDEGEREWQVVQRRTGRRSSAPCSESIGVA